jgi:hypothetical protein
MKDYRRSTDEVEDERKETQVSENLETRKIKYYNREASY